VVTFVVAAVTFVGIIVEMVPYIVDCCRVVRPKVYRSACKTVVGIGVHQHLCADYTRELHYKKKIKN
jgi:hypothetical protein